MRTGVIGVSVVALSLLTAACGTNQEQRAATGGFTGLGIGALVGGPIGAIVGAAAGAAGGTLMPEDATSIANNLLGREHRAAKEMINGNSRTASAQTMGSGSSQATMQHRDYVRDAQTRLKEQGYYHGQVDGIVGPKTHSALRAYQKHEGLRQTARLDSRTMDRLNVAPQANSGSSTAPATDQNNSEQNNSEQNGGYNQAPQNSYQNGNGGNNQAPQNDNQNGGVNQAPQNYQAPTNASPAAPPAGQQ